jgi:hypothetical protein
MKKNNSFTRGAACALAVATLAQASAACAEDERNVHPLMTSKVWLNVGAFFAARDLNISVEGTTGEIAREFNVESSLGVNDRPDLFMTELGWQFAERWDVALQHFRSDRRATRTLQDTIEWEDVIYEVGVDVSAETKISITRLFFARRILEEGPHDLRLGVGVHWLDANTSITGEATLDDMTTDFRTSAATASLPIPNLGIWYRYSPSNKWLLSTRIDWLSADVGKYNGTIWNAAASADYRLTEHFGVGLAYQHFVIDGGIKDSGWRGNIRTQFSGLHLHFTGYW